MPEVFRKHRCLFHSVIRKCRHLLSPIQRNVSGGLIRGHEGHTVSDLWRTFGPQPSSVPGAPSPPALISQGPGRPQCTQAADRCAVALRHRVTRDVHLLILIPGSLPINVLAEPKSLP